MKNLIKNVLGIGSIIIGLFGLIIWIISLLTQFFMRIINLMIHSSPSFNMWGLWFILVIIVGVLIIIFIPEKD